MFKNSPIEHKGFDITNYSASESQTEGVRLNQKKVLQELCMVVIVVNALVERSKLREIKSNRVQDLLKRLQELRTISFL